MTCLLTASGAMVDLRFMAEESIRIEDIAHHLAQLNRYTGACSRPYSVAEHSLLVCDLVLQTLIAADPAVLLAALMHDAHEAYTADVSAPMKQLLADGWSVAEARIQRAVLARFGLAEASREAAALIHWADMTALSTERTQLMPDAGPRWPELDEYPPRRTCDVDLRTRHGFAWSDWRQAFLDRFQELDFARAQPEVL